MENLYNIMMYVGNVQRSLNVVHAYMEQGKPIPRDLYYHLITERSKLRKALDLEIEEITERFRQQTER